MGLLAQHRMGLIQSQNGEEAAVVFTQGLRAVTLTGAEVQTVPRGGGDPTPPCGEAMGNGVQNIGGEPHQTVLLVLLKGHRHLTVPFKKCPLEGQRAGKIYDGETHCFFCLAEKKRERGPFSFQKRMAL